MNEVMEILYQWHQGAGIKAITRSLGYDRKGFYQREKASMRPEQFSSGNPTLPCPPAFLIARLQ